MIASPMNFSTVPPCRSSAVAHLVEVAGHHLAERLRVEALARLVEPLRSEKTIVTVFRTSCAGNSANEGRPAEPAEAETRRVLLAAARADGHVSV